MQSPSNPSPGNAPDQSVFAVLTRWRGWWVMLVLLGIGLLASVPLAYQIMRPPSISGGLSGQHLTGPR